ncbi:hypothetical protein ES288_D07G075900v1 [Gossypium darwinii]|uniref:GPI ethanolamine phosphate transferase 1 n=1 Tax=Gossypium darwinii TaxID=34276 RepID=A0A5D2BT69_GOSDA|nr:hypothetical protein ES288_D07G075900v1 [Gossypium darwinii]
METLQEFFNQIQTLNCVSPNFFFTLRETKVTKKVDIDGILGNRDSKLGKPSIPRRRKWVKRRETWLVILGVILYAVYMLSIFDIYFKTPIVHGMDLVSPRFSPSAKRLVLLVARFGREFQIRNVIKNQSRSLGSISCSASNGVKAWTCCYNCSIIRTGMPNLFWII